MDETQGVATRRLGVPAAIAVVVAGSAVSGACAAAEESVAPLYALEACQRVALVDTDLAQAVIGVEDLAYDPVRRALLLSAYDRRAAETAAGRRKSASIPEGGLYSVPVSSILDAADEPLPVASIIDRSELPGGLRPHGIDIDFSAGEIVFINRAYQKIDDRWRMAPHLARFSLDGARGGVDAETAVHCAANDVVSSGAVALISNDHGACGWDAVGETVFGAKRSGLADANGHVLFQSARFANGVADLGDGALALAATRENAVHVLSATGSAFARKATLSLPGSPDNLTIDRDGTLTAAVHPSLWRLALHRKLGIGTAPSRVVRVDPATGAVDLLFDDPSGRLFSAATVAVDAGEALILGSATDSGLLVCRKDARIAHRNAD